MCAEFIIKEQKLELIGDVISDSFPPLTIVRSGIPSNSGRIYGNNLVVIFISDYQFGAEISNVMVKVIYDFASRHQCNLIISSKPIDFTPNNKKDLDLQIPPNKQEFQKLIQESKERRGKEKVWFSTNDENIAKKLINLGHSAIQEVVVSGIGGGILADSVFSKYSSYLFIFSC